MFLIQRYIFLIFFRLGSTNRSKRVLIGNKRKGGAQNIRDKKQTDKKGFQNLACRSRPTQATSSSNFKHPTLYSRIRVTNI